MPRIPGRYIGNDPVRGTVIYRPLLTVRFTLATGLTFVLGDVLVDSGADVTTIPAGVLKGFGIPFDSLPPHMPTETAGGNVMQRLCIGDVSFLSHTFATSFAVLKELRTPVVGRGDFFETFKVDFADWILNPPFFRVTYPRPRQRA